MAITLQPLNTITLAANTPTQLIAPGPGHYYFQVLNRGPGQLGVGRDSSVSAGGASSLTMGTDYSYTGQPLWGPDGIWVSSSAAGTVAVALIPKQGDGWAPPPTGVIVGGGGGGGGTSITPAPPAAPEAGALWFDPARLELFIWYVGPSGNGQWIGLIPPPGGGGVSVSPAPPTSPASGAFWFDSSSLTLYIWYIGPSGSGQWVGI